MKSPLTAPALRGATIPFGCAGRFGLLVGTAFLSVTPLWGAELPPPKATPPLTRIFIGVPNQLPLPPNFPIEAETSAAPAAPHEASADATSYKPKLEENKGDAAAKTPGQMRSPSGVTTAMTRADR